MPFSHLITAAATPVVLITADAIFLSSVITKYTAIANQARDLAGEWRDGKTTAARRENLRGQLRLFSRRLRAMWAASLALCLALLLFLTTVLAAVFADRARWIGMLGSGTLVTGLLAVGASVLLELREIGLARLTIAGELSDVFAENEKTPL